MKVKGNLVAAIALGAAMACGAGLAAPPRVGRGDDE